MFWLRHGHGNLCTFAIFTKTSSSSVNRYSQEIDGLETHAEISRRHSVHQIDGVNVRQCIAAEALRARLRLSFDGHSRKMVFQ